MQISTDDLIPAVRAMWQVTMGKTSPFHLAACAACDGPSFQQPCPCCGAYPDASEPRSVTEARRDAAQRRGAGSRDRFIASVEHAGGVGAWYFASFRRTVAYAGSPGRETPDHAFRAAIDGLVERARSMSWPSPGEVWDHVSRDRQALSGDYLADYEVWSRMADEDHGEGAVRWLREKQDGRSWHSWPENCAEGREILRSHGLVTLERLGVPEAAHQAEDVVVPGLGL